MGVQEEGNDSGIYEINNSSFGVDSKTTEKDINPLK